MNLQDASSLGVSESFRKVADEIKPTRCKKPTSPFSCRLTEEECDILRQQVGSWPPGAYFRERLSD